MLHYYPGTHQCPSSVEVAGRGPAVPVDFGGTSLQADGDVEVGGNAEFSAKKRTRTDGCHSRSPSGSDVWATAVDASVSGDAGEPAGVVAPKHAGVLHADGTDSELAAIPVACSSGPFCGAGASSDSAAVLQTGDPHCNGSDAHIASPAESAGQPGPELNHEVAGVCVGSVSHSDDLHDCDDWLMGLRGSSSPECDWPATNTLPLLLCCVAVVSPVAAHALIALAAIAFAAVKVLAGQCESLCKFVALRNTSQPVQFATFRWERFFSHWTAGPPHFFVVHPL